MAVSEDVTPILGSGYRIGFMGLFHMNIFKERLETEFNQTVRITSASVPYKLEIHQPKLGETTELVIINPCLVRIN